MVLADIEAGCQIRVFKVLLRSSVPRVSPDTVTLFTYAYLDGVEVCSSDKLVFQPIDAINGDWQRTPWLHSLLLVTRDRLRIECHNGTESVSVVHLTRIYHKVHDSSLKIRSRQVPAQKFAGFMLLSSSCLRCTMGF